METTAKTYTVDTLKVVVAENRTQLGKISATSVSNLIKNLLKQKDELRIIFAAAPSQNELLEELSRDASIPWHKIIAFHMDEYIGLPKKSDKLFGVYLSDHIFSKVVMKAVHLIDSQEKDVEKEIRRYTALLTAQPIDIVLMGVGENGHVAFNDPPVADFHDPKVMKVVELEERDKVQQVNDAGFASVNDVPKTAYTLTVPTLLAATHLIIVVPSIRKAEAINKTLTSSITTACPATILRTHKNATLFIDKDSASLVEAFKK